VGKVSETMSAAYAERHRVLPVQVTPTEVVVATAEPFLTDWVAEVERQSRRTVRRVLASPGEIQRYTVEFFALAKSVRAAQKAGGNAGGASFEQLVELGRSNKQLDANDQGVVQVVDWLWQYAFDQRASDIHLEPRREQGTIRFRIDGGAAPGLPDADRRAQRDDRAHQAARSHGRDREAPPAGTAASRPATRAATRSRCACPRCQRPSARRW
jgi:general secretion pathway protein E